MMSLLLLLEVGWSLVWDDDCIRSLYRFLGGCRWEGLLGEKKGLVWRSDEGWE